jgi:hypothetical protein
MRTLAPALPRSPHKSLPHGCCGPVAGGQVLQRKCFGHLLKDLFVAPTFWIECEQIIGRLKFGVDQVLVTTITFRSPGRTRLTRRTRIWALP